MFIEHCIKINKYIASIKMNFSDINYYTVSALYCLRQLCLFV